jgi:hypothetical protein
MNDVNKPIPEELKSKLKRQKNIIATVCTAIGIFFGLVVLGQILTNELHIVTILFFLVFFFSGIIMLLNNNFREDGYIKDDDMAALNIFFRIFSPLHMRFKKKK